MEIGGFEVFCITTRGRKSRIVFHTLKKGILLFKAQAFKKLWKTKKV